MRGRIGGPGWLLLSAIVVVSLTACNESEDEPAQVVAIMEATATPTAFVEELLATPTPGPKMTPQVKIERAPYQPVGAINAEPYRVTTGDGDCLNVRPSPGTTFKTDPRTCVNDGYLLWLYGPSKDVDGFTWRYALGEGWVATQYITADPSAKNLLDGRIPSVIVSVTDQVDDYIARVDSGGKITSLARGQHAVQDFGNKPTAISPDGKRAAGTAWDGGASYVVITDLRGGPMLKLPGATFLAWSSDGKGLALLQTADTFVTVLMPGDSQLRSIARVPSNAQGYAWAPDGNSILFAAEGSSLYRLNLSGEIEKLTRGANGEYIGELSASPDGKWMLSSITLGAVRVLGLDGTTKDVPRAKQLQVGGRCGGASGRLSGWLNDRTVMWHESYAEKGGNGITIASLDGGPNRIIPFFTLNDLRVVSPGLISFTTYESIEVPGTVAKGFPLTWLMDVASGEARPITVGDGPTWVK